MAATIGFIGAGNMARSLVGGLIADGYGPANIWVSSPRSEKVESFAQQFGVNVSTDNTMVAKHADVIVLSVKPQVVESVAGELSAIIGDRRSLVISIAAGIRIAKIQSWLNAKVPVVRCMPNTPALLRAGATALFASDEVTQAQKDLAESIMRSVGLAVWVDQEALLDTVTALSGSGPAYFFMVIEMLQKAAQDLGLSEQTAKLLTLQTALGASKMALESNIDAGTLREQVTSKGGTTEAALTVFKEGELSELVFKAVQAAKQRAEELSQ